MGNARRIAGYLLLGSLFALNTIGCGKNTAEADPDLAALSDLVYDMSDLALNASKFQRRFAQGAAPKDNVRKEYNKYVFKLAQDPEVNGDSAQLSVLVCSAEQETPVRWAAVKEAGTWKLTVAPLK